MEVKDDRGEIFQKSIIHICFVTFHLPHTIIFYFGSKKYNPRFLLSPFTSLKRTIFLNFGCKKIQPLLFVVTFHLHQGYLKVFLFHILPPSF